MSDGDAELSIMLEQFVNLGVHMDIKLMENIVNCVSLMVTGLVQRMGSVCVSIVFITRASHSHI